jgi:hypothetical protein
VRLLRHLTGVDNANRVEDMVSVMTKPRRLPLPLLLLICSACKSGACAPAAPAPPAQTFSCSRMTVGDPGATEYECPDAASAQICASQSVVTCRPSNRTRGNVPPGGECRRGTWDPDARAFELGDDCAPNARFAGEDTPKGSVCVKEESAGPYCTHNCQAADECADVLRYGFTSDCRGGGCFLIHK